ncbi:MAG TPA: hypothetical protein VGN72_07650 [Tepidisphaeraceae bacterium]|jgi:hypothetical protein|nr:hypothetical protein [Tepidisphaeraceae bacterium]
MASSKRRATRDQPNRPADGRRAIGVSFKPGIDYSRGIMGDSSYEMPSDRWPYGRCSFALMFSIDRDAVLRLTSTFTRRRCSLLVDHYVRGFSQQELAVLRNVTIPAISMALADIRHSFLANRLPEPKPVRSQRARNDVPEHIILGPRPGRLALYLAAQESRDDRHRVFDDIRRAYQADPEQDTLGGRGNPYIVSAIYAAWRNANPRTVERHRREREGAIERQHGPAVRQQQPRRRRRRRARRRKVGRSGRPS